MNETEMKVVTMTIKATGKTVCMFGNSDNGKWFERYYPTFEVAEKFAAKRGWISTRR